jgi:tRNA nucleotidyltransferase (CCA-adding enzyme)
MSDYVYILESHLSPDQNRVVADVQTAAGQNNVSLFLTGGAMRDMLAGYRIRDLDFVVEGNAVKVAKAVAEATGAKTVSVDEQRKSVELLFPTGVTVEIAMARNEKYTKTGAKPQISPATIQDDLRRRDFACNAVALSLSRASRGLLLDPMNGLADVERRELRAISNYGFYDDPVRLLRLIRLRVRLGFTVEERTSMQVANAREAEVEKFIPGRAFGEELKRIGAEDQAPDILKSLDETGLLAILAPAIAGPKLNLAALGKFDKAVRLVPDDFRWRAARWGTFLAAVIEKLSSKERTALFKSAELTKAEIDAWQKLEARSKKLEAALKSARIRKPSQVYHLVIGAAPDEVIFLLYKSALKPVQERLRSYFQKYLPAIQEITPEEWESISVKPGTPKYAKARDEFITHRLDRRPKKPDTPPPAPEPEMAVVRRGR